MIRGLEALTVEPDETLVIKINGRSFIGETALLDSYSNDIAEGLRAAGLEGRSVVIIEHPAIPVEFAKVKATELTPA